MSAASSETKDGPPAAETIIYPKGSPERSKDAPPPEKSSTSPLYLMVALTLAAAGAWILIQRRKAGQVVPRGTRKLQIDETRSLGNRQYLVVADYDGKKFLLGVTPGQIQLIADLREKPAPEVKP